MPARLMLGFALFALTPACASLAASAPDILSTDRIVVEESGAGAPVVFTPGLTSSPDVFDAAIATIDGEIHKVAIRGFAGVPAPDDTEKMVEPAAEALAAYLNEKDLADVTLVGHSMGGVVSLLTAAQTNRVTQVLVVDAVPFLAALFQPGATPEGAAAGRAAMRAQMAQTSDAQYLAIVRQGLPRQAISSAAQARVFTDAQASDIEAAKTAFIELSTTDYRPQLANINAKITVLVPFDSATGFSKDAVRARYEAQYAAFPSVEIRMVDNSRHFIMLDAPDAFAAELARIVGIDGEQ